jgi:diguanylate cyclase (GGDEF)-like protein
MAWAAAIPARHAWGAVLIALPAVGLADAASGPQLWFGPLYLLVICVAAWGLGRCSAVMVGFACAAASLAANGPAFYPAGAVAIEWNLSMRAVAVILIIVLVGSVRHSYDREWERARFDALTGILNRQAFYESARAQDDHGWRILAYVDLDGFKKVNDCYGHATGDETLRTFAAKVSAMVRDEDLFARIGGDEFLLLIPVGSETEGHRLARQLHQRMEAALGRLAYPIGCSMGVLLLGPREASLTDADVQRADQLMYEAKREGASLRISTTLDPDPARLGGAVPADPAGTLPATA